MHPSPPETLARVDGANGELVLRRVGDDLEVVSNGVFLMDTRDGRSERLLVSAALDTLRAASAGVAPRPRWRVLVGGLGVGFSVAEALAAPDVAEVVVVERERAVLDWCGTHLAPYSGHALDDPRLRPVHADLVTWLREPDGAAGLPYDAVCLDVDNGPGWTVTDANAALYGEDGLAGLARVLAPGGVLTVWSAQEAPAFVDALRRRFDDVAAQHVPVTRGEPDVVLVARGPRP
jgi:spermidine synthase